MLTANKLWSKQSEFGAEVEAGELLYGFVRLAKPKICIETGCAEGDTAEWIGKALQKNGFGVLYTCDTDESAVLRASSRLRDLPVTVYQRPGIELLSGSWQSDFVFIDSGWLPHRLEEARYIVENPHVLSPHALVCCHDVCQNYGPVYDLIRERTNWQSLVIQTPYGLGIFQNGEPDFSYRGKMVDLK